MKSFFYCLILVVIPSLAAMSQTNLQKSFQDCHVVGSITLYDYKSQKWTFSDKADSENETLPASTFKIIHSLIALEAGVIKDEMEIIKWIGETDTVLYGYRPDIYKDMNLKEAFETSAVWFYLELAKRIDKKQYQQYLKKCKYGNLNLTEPGIDFWNFGAFGISPENQIAFLKNLYEEKLPFSKRNIQIVKRIMLTEKGDNHTIYAKTGWTRQHGKDIGWWVGFVERKDNVYFFATRIIKDRTIPNPDFAACRKEITKVVLKETGIIE